MISTGIYYFRGERLGLVGEYMKSSSKLDAPGYYIKWLSMRCLILIIVGFFVGSIFDSFHTISETTVYTNPVIFKMAWWSPFVFGLAALSIGLLLPVTDGFLKRKDIRLTLSIVICGLIVFGGVYFLSGFAPLFKLSKNLIVPLGTIVIWLFFDKTWQGIVEGVVVAFWGAFIEILLICEISVIEPG